jgi:hypothetical protein
VYSFTPFSLSPLNIWGWYAPMFSVDFNTAGLSDGPQNISGNVYIGPYATNISVTGNVSSNGNDSANITIGDTILTVEKTVAPQPAAPTGATGGTGGTGASGGVN